MCVEKNYKWKPRREANVRKAFMIKVVVRYNDLMYSKLGIPTNIYSKLGRLFCMGCLGDQVRTKQKPRQKNRCMGDPIVEALETYHCGPQSVARVLNEMVNT